MATIYQVLGPTAGILRTTAFPQLVQANGTNIPVRGLAFDQTTEEAVFFHARAIKYGSGNLNFDIDWYAASGTSGGVVWGVQIAAITANTDTQDIETDALATIATTATTHLGTTAKRLHRTTVTVSSLDSLAVDDFILIRLARVAANGSDTLAADAICTLVTMSYSDV